eukprot:scaffold5128_cov104-Isochrysis_galbana.AAC.2
MQGEMRRRRETAWRWPCSRNETSGSNQQAGHNSVRRHARSCQSPHLKSERRIRSPDHGSRVAAARSSVFRWTRSSRGAPGRRTRAQSCQGTTARQWCRCIDDT